ncbi:MAG: sel1 repeat family protein [Bacilli bacterium]|jgi:hypothetical protein|nr:sel1 repeat family protein [Bacilli bacterium]
MRRKKITSKEAYSCLAGSSVFKGLDKALIKGNQIVLEKNDNDYFDLDAYFNWFKKRIDLKVSEEDFVSFIFFVYLCFKNAKYDLNDYSLKANVQIRIADLVKKYSDAYDPTSGAYLLTDEQKIQNIESCYEDIKRYKDNEALPLEQRNLKNEEKMFLLRQLSERGVLTLEERDAFEKMLVSLAAQDSPWACLFYASYLYGEGVDEDTGIIRNYAKSLTYYLKAGRLGDYQGYMLAGYIYYYNRLNDPAGPDYPSAFRCFSFGAEHNDLEAFYKLSDMYYHGYFVEKNILEATFLLKSHYYDALSNAYWKGDYYFIGPFALRLGKIMEDNGLEKDRQIILAFYLLAEYSYQLRLKKNNFFGDREVLSRLKEDIKRMDQKLLLEPVPFALPYELSEDEIILGFDSMFSFPPTNERGLLKGLKGSNKLTLTLYQNEEGAFPYPLIKANKVLLFTNIRLLMVLDKPLEEDVNERLGERALSAIAFYPHLGMTIKEGTYQLESLTILGFSLSQDPIREVGSLVKLIKDKANVVKGSLGQIKEIEESGNEFLVEFYSSSGQVLNLLKVATDEVSFLRSKKGEVKI